MAYSTITKPSLHFNTKLYTGTGSSSAKTGVGFQPDWVWIKQRSGTEAHVLFDVLRTPAYRIYSNYQSAQTNSGSSTRLVSFDSDGFTEGGDGMTGGNNATYASWNWKGGGSGSANTDGTINSTVSANTTSGFSIVKYSGTGSNGTVGHGLGAAPKVVLVKNLGQATDWYMYHEIIGNTKSILLNSTNGQTSAYSDNWNNTSPTTTTFSVGTSGAINSSIADHIAYCFAEKKGYSKFGYYEGNSSTNGRFVYLGFKPAFLLLKKYTANGQQWYIFDSKRDGKNQGDGASGGNRALRPNTDSAEEQASGYPMDILSNGFKWRGSSTEQNSSGQSYIYLAFAEEPLVANVGASIPATAR